MNKPFKPIEELVSLNEELHTEFAIVELEQRLETDPLMLANLLSGGICTVEGAFGPICTGNYCSEEGGLVICEIKYKDGGDFCTPIGGGNLCTPICDRIA